MHVCMRMPEFARVVRVCVGVCIYRVGVGACAYDQFAHTHMCNSIYTHTHMYIHVHTDIHTYIHVQFERVVRVCVGVYI